MSIDHVPMGLNFWSEKNELTVKAPSMSIGSCKAARETQWQARGRCNKNLHGLPPFERGSRGFAPQRAV